MDLGGKKLLDFSDSILWEFLTEWLTGLLVCLEIEFERILFWIASLFGVEMKTVDIELGDFVMENIEFLAAAVDIEGGDVEGDDVKDDDVEGDELFVGDREEISRERRENWEKEKDSLDVDNELLGENNDEGDGRDDDDDGIWEKGDCNRNDDCRVGCDDDSNKWVFSLLFNALPERVSSCK